MLTVVSFADCIRENLKDRRYGKERADAIIADFKARAEAHMSDGKTEVDAATLAMRDTFENMSNLAAEKAKRTAKMLALQAENRSLIEEAMKIDVVPFTLKDIFGKQVGPRGSRGVALARAAISRVEKDQRFTGLAYHTKKDIYRGQLGAAMDDVFDKLNKGAFGRQKGKAHQPNIVKEVFGEHTGDQIAKDFADGWLRVSDLAVDLFNQAGGSMRRLARYLPQKQNAAKLVKAGKENWSSAMLDALDWGKTRWPDGSTINPEDRLKLLGNIYDTLTTDGATKIDDKAFRGRGVAVGNMLDQNRFMHIKNADSWLKVHEQFGDGEVFDVLMGHVDGMAHKTALVDVFGPNPSATVANLEAMIKKAAASLSPKEKADAEAVLKNKFRPMMDLVEHNNPMNPHSMMGAVVSGTSNILSAAQLGAAPLLAMPGDFMQTMGVRLADGMPVVGDHMGFYLKSLASDRELMQQMARQAGAIMDHTVGSTYAATRFNALATVGPAVTRRIADTVHRTSLLSGHTAAARWTAQAELMGLLHRSRGTEFDDLPFKDMMSRYGIDSKTWDVVRKNVAEWNPSEGVKFLRPLDILKTDIPGSREVFHKFQGMMLEQARMMVPESTMEATVMLRGNTRPDTLRGLMLHSFSMYKNFPLSFWMIYGRLAMTNPSVKGRLGFYAGLGAGMTLVGALGTQMRELKDGKDPMPMNDPKFWGKALLAGGAMSIWGDFLFNGVNKMGRGPADTAAGPLLGLAGDTSQLLFGDAFKWADSLGTLGDKDFKSTTAAKAVEFAKRYTPGTSVWWARKALEIAVWDRFEELADPKVYQKRMRKEQKQRKTYGNEYWWRPGQGLPDRAPSFKEP